jgi:inorganic pyrophosphatase
VDALHPFYLGIGSYRQLPTILTEQIAHFFQHYKDLEKGKETRSPAGRRRRMPQTWIRQGVERNTEAALTRRPDASPTAPVCP